MTNKKVAFLFDLNGTIIDDMAYHVKGWHNILNNFGANLSIEEVKLQCYGKNEELLERIFPKRFSEKEMEEMVLQKETAYQKAFAPYLKLIDGLGDFLKYAKQQNIPMAIGSAAIPFNINFVLDGLNLQEYFAAKVSAYDVTESKPHPETFLKCAQLLKVNPADCFVFEDSPKGVEAASNAGMKSVVITTMHTKEEFTDENIICFIENYKGALFNKILNATF